MSSCAMHSKELLIIILMTYLQKVLNTVRWWSVIMISQVDDCLLIVISMFYWLLFLYKGSWLMLATVERCLSEWWRWSEGSDTLLHNNLCMPTGWLKQAHSTIVLHFYCLFYFIAHCCSPCIGTKILFCFSERVFIYILLLFAFIKEKRKVWYHWRWTWEKITTFWHLFKLWYSACLKSTINELV